MSLLQRNYNMTFLVFTSSKPIRDFCEEHGIRVQSGVR